MKTSRTTEDLKRLSLSLLLVLFLLEGLSEAATVTAIEKLAETMLELVLAEENQVLPQYQRKEFELPLNNTSDPVVNEEERTEYFARVNLDLIIT